jgi:N-acetylneuraminate synthase
MPESIFIEGRKIGPDAPTYVIAEMSANHNQDINQAKRIIRAAKEAGADAVKLQTYTADTLTLDCDAEPFMVRGGTLWDGRTLHDLYAEAFTPWEWQGELKQFANELGLTLFSSPFDDTAVEFLEKLEVPAYKIASFELVDTGLLRRVARTGKPVIMSTGMATLAEIDDAMATLREAGAREIALLKCTSAYPSPPDEMNLRTIPHLAAAFDVPVGLSDHTLDVAVPVAAVALGACILEKHLTLSRSDAGPDSGFSLEPKEFKQTVDMVRVAERALGSVHYGVTEKDRKSRVFRRSLFAVQDIRAGEPFTKENVRSIRPAHGMSPRELDRVLTRHAACDIKRGTPLEWDHLTHRPTCNG